MEQLQPCPECKTALEPWEVTCHSCGTVVSLEAVPIVFAASGSEDQVEEAFHNWFDRGIENMQASRFEDADICFREALRRCRNLKDAQAQELDVRTNLAKALEKSDKVIEAAEQYKLLSELTPDQAEAKEWSDKANELAAGADLANGTAQEEEFFPVAQDEYKFVPLYCAGCKRLLNEAEVFGYRQRKQTEVRCLCGVDATPLVKHDVHYRHALAGAQALKGRKAKLIQSASEDFPHGKQKSIAIALALLLGNFGAHKFYLGEPGAGYLSIGWFAFFALLVFFCQAPGDSPTLGLLCFPVFLPWLIAVFEAIHYMHMSPVTFNLSYNIDKVLAKIPPDFEAPPTPPEVFSVEITDDPEDFIDELSYPRNQ